MKKFAAAFLFLAISFGAFAQTMFQKVYSTPWPTPAIYMMSEGDDGIVQLSDGGYAVLVLRTAPSSALVMLRTDLNGDTVWTRSYQFTYPCEPNSFIATNDGGFLMCCSSGGNSTCIKTDSLGNIIWDKDIHPASSVYDVHQFADSSYLLLLSENWVRISSSGNIISSKQIQIISSVFENTSDGGYIATGFNDGINNNQGAYLTKLDANENVMWCKTIYYSLTPYSPAPGIFIHQLSDGGYLFGGNCDTAGVSIHRNPYLVRTDSLGNVLWGKTYALDGEILSCALTNDGGFVMAGGHLGNCIILKTDGNGILQWSKTYENDTSHVGGGAIKIIQTADNGFALVGVSLYGAGANRYGVAIIKTDSLGNSGCNGVAVNISTGTYPLLSLPYSPGTAVSSFTTSVDGISSISCPAQANLCPLSSIRENVFSAEISVYPNPSFSDFTFDLNNAIVPRETKLILFDCFGNKIREEKITQQKTTISKSNLASGIYFWQITSESGLLGSGKICVQE